MKNYNYYETQLVKNLKLIINLRFYLYHIEVIIGFLKNFPKLVTGVGSKGSI